MNTACIILAGGQGKRMASTDTHKVCFPILGRPAICRAIDAYKQAGIRYFVVVVGQMSEQVISTVSAEHPEVTFVYQSEPKGTGHAALVAARSLEAQGFGGAAFVTMGDKVIAPHVVTELLERFEGKRPALALATLPYDESAGAGRVVLDGDGGVLGIIEKPDLEAAWEKGSAISLDGTEVPSTDLKGEHLRCNGSLYLFRFGELSRALDRLTTGNVQGELYLTDTVGLLRHEGAEIEAVEVNAKEDLMAFNTPAELVAIEQVLRAREQPRRVRARAGSRLGSDVIKPAGEWLSLLRNRDEGLFSVLAGLYGSQREAVEEQAEQILRVVERFVERYGEERAMILCRAPGRINLMGRHIEHRGGDVNVMAISRETIVAAAPREDDEVRLHNLDAGFPDRRFRIRELLEGTSWDTWVDLIDSHTAREVLEQAPGDWSHYARAPLLRLQHEAPDIPLAGMDCVVGGNIPMGAGLSSSSALVVAFAEAAIAFNGLNVEIADLIDLCGEGEWFVGSRGGNGDHAAIRTSTIGSVTEIGFFPFQFKKQVPLPEHLRVIVAHSGIEAKKSDGAKDAFNHRIAAYEIAQMLLVRKWPPAAGIRRLRDLCPHHLGVGTDEIYRALKLLPERPTRDDLRALCTDEEQERLDRLFATHVDIGPYDLRGIVVYGLSECLRSERFAIALETGNLEEIGRLMATSHDGDRVVVRGDGEKPRPFSPDLSDPALDALAAQNADLLHQCGVYACSTQEIDDLVELANAVPGVIGAQLSGAGLGGCVMILAEEAAVGPLFDHLETTYYRSRGLEKRLYNCLPVQGAGLVRLSFQEAQM